MSSTEKKPSARKRTTSSTTRKTTATTAKTGTSRTRATRLAAATPKPSHQDIERRAYELFLSDGRHGHELEHWLQAERELRRA